MKGSNTHLVESKQREIQGTGIYSMKVDNSDSIISVSPKQIKTPEICRKIHCNETALQGQGTPFEERKDRSPP